MYGPFPRQIGYAQYEDASPSVNGSFAPPAVVHQGFRAVLAERARLEAEVSRQQEQNLEMQRKSTSDKAVIEELKLQVRRVHM